MARPRLVPRRAVAALPRPDRGAADAARLAGRGRRGGWRASGDGGSGRGGWEASRGGWRDRDSSPRRPARHLLGRIAEQRMLRGLQGEGGEEGGEHRAMVAAGGAAGKLVGGGGATATLPPADRRGTYSTGSRRGRCRSLCIRRRSSQTYGARSRPATDGASF